MEGCPHQRQRRKPAPAVAVSDKIEDIPVFWEMEIYTHFLSVSMTLHGSFTLLWGNKYLTFDLDPFFVGKQWHASK